MPEWCVLVESLRVRSKKFYLPLIMIVIRNSYISKPSQGCLLLDLLCVQLSRVKVTGQLIPAYPRLGFLSLFTRTLFVNRLMLSPSIQLFLIHHLCVYRNVRCFHFFQRIFTVGYIVCVFISSGSDGAIFPTV